MALDKKKITTILLDEKVKNYSFSIGFFLIFSLFVFFAIRPNLVTAFNLQQELQKLKLQNREYEEQILLIVDYQTVIEENRDRFVLLDEAIPITPNVVKVLDDIRNSASDSGMILETLAVESIELNEDITAEQTSEVYTFNITVSGNIELAQLKTFFDSIINQRRIKSIEFLQISQATLTEEGTTRYLITLSLVGHYL